ncbi:MAG TPA: DNA polymerase III subunit gamma/tau [Spirochaetales bacterium]|jgi:DNA polymerase-3 subunit gamma/tau|nr:DNA polymerase III subunit gamma/tau [Spirochaetales bacterium]
MVYEVTARRRRPQLFDSLVGQQFVVSTLKNSIEQQRIAHAYLFSGPRGVGKTSAARILAKALNCEKGPTPYPCGVCSHCLEITRGSSPDVIEIDGASNTSVNDVRVIREEILFPPQSSRYKIYIIDEVHMLSISAFNALLKTIEEPPAYVVFIFATTETHKVPATIRSRCQQFLFQLIPLEIIKGLLKEVAVEMGVEAEDEALFWIAKEATGSMRDAYTLFDQVVAFSDGAITLAKIEEKLSLSGLENLSKLVASLLNGESGGAFDVLEELLARGISVEQTIKDLGEYIRCLLLIKRGVTNEALLGVNPKRIPQEIREGFSEEQLEAALELFLELYRNSRFSLNPRFELELALSRLSNLSKMVSSATLVEQLIALKTTLAEGAEVVATPTTTPPRVEVPKVEVKEKVVVVKEFNKALLPELIQALAKERQPAGMVLSQASNLYRDAEGVKIVFSSAYALDNANQNKDVLINLLQRVAGYEGRVDFLKEAPPPVVNEQEKDPLLKEIASMFRGEVLETHS